MSSCFKSVLPKTKVVVDEAELETRFGKPFFGFYNISVEDKTKLGVVQKHLPKLQAATREKGGVWLVLPQALLRKEGRSLLDDFDIYYSDRATGRTVLVYGSPQALEHVPPHPSANIGTHIVLIAEETGRAPGQEALVLVTVEHDGRGGEMMSLPGGHLDMSDAGITSGLLREVAEEVGQPELLTKFRERLGVAAIRFVPNFKRLGGTFVGQDVWFLFSCVVPKAVLDKYCERRKVNCEVKTVQLERLNSIQAGWLTPEIRSAINEGGSMRYIDTTYNGIPAQLFRV
eukprot:TRINITY_DN23569_c0_g1_i1.p1 TRINITY_DN23569_c0_g1~~TRINITY_DN23569_c0_g1_i1.p1  ORF type:complete len:299 (-),score=30.74 TRINITY_DN23569_c0_g1_i1:86-946(-)